MGTKIEYDGAVIKLKDEYVISKEFQKRLKRMAKKALKEAKRQNREFKNGR
jgi:hypothetical protein